MPANNISARNRNLLNSSFRFKDGAPLKRFIQQATSSTEESFTLREILNTLKDVIKTEKLYDETNPSIIICSDELEAVLDRKALHVNQIRELIMDQLTPDNRPPHEPNGAEPITSPRYEPHYMLKPALRRVFESMETFNREQTVFRYGEITALLSTYILNNRHLLLDIRNVFVLKIQDDPLGEAFRVNTFHRSQTHALLKTAIIPVHPTNPIIVSDGSHDIIANVILFQNLTITDDDDTEMEPTDDSPDQ